MGFISRRNGTKEERDELAAVRDVPNEDGTPEADEEKDVRRETLQRFAMALHSPNGFLVGLHDGVELQNADGPNNQLDVWPVTKAGLVWGSFVLTSLTPFALFSISSTQSPSIYRHIYIS